MARGKQQREKKQCFDAMLPAKRAMEQEWMLSGDGKKSMEAGLTAAREELSIQRQLLQQREEQPNLCERSIGHQDPGATSFVFLLEAIASQK